MENFALATFLFLVYFCFACCLFSSPIHAATLEQEEVITAAPVEPIQMTAEVSLSLEPTVNDEEVIANVTPPQEELNQLEGVKENPTLADLLVDIDLDTLQLRPARKIAKALNIKQTVSNGKKKADKPLDWLRREIKQKLQQNPEEVAPVIKEVINAA